MPFQRKTIDYSRPFTLSSIEGTIVVKKGFTLIELLVVIAILGVLASFTSIALIGHQKQARDAQRKSDLQQVKRALQAAKNDCKGAAYYPYSNLSDLSTNPRNAYDHLVSDLVLAKYLTSKINDPKSTSALTLPYAYSYYPDYPSINAGYSASTYCPSLFGGSYTSTLATETAMLRVKLENSKDPDIIKAYNNCPKLDLDTTGITPPYGYYYLTQPSNTDGYYYVCME